MNGFISDFERPVSSDGEHHYEYVPTQIVTEFFRSAAGFDHPLDGIIYNSVKNRGGVCVVLFIDRSEVDDVADPSKSPTGPRLLKVRRVRNKRNGANQK